MISAGYILCASYLALQCLLIFLLLRFRRKSQEFFSANSEQAPLAEKAPGISVLVPIKGPVASLKENITALLAQDYPGPIQIVLAFQDAQDPDLAIADAIKPAAAGREVTILRGLRPLGLNLKNSNLCHALKAAKYDWLYCGDADTWVPANFLSTAQRLTDGNKQIFVTAISVHQGPRNLGACLEAVGTNLELSSYFLMTHLGKNGAMNGGAMLFQRELLMSVGGFESFLNQITDDLAMRRAFAQTGALCKLSPCFARVRLDQQTWTGFWRRQLRWQMIARCFDPGIFYFGAQINFIGQYLLFAGVWAGSTTLMNLGVVVLLARVGRSLIFQIGLQTPRTDWWKAVVLPIYDMASVLIWLNTAFARRVQWAGRILVVQRSGALRELEAG